MTLLWLLAWCEAVGLGGEPLWLAGKNKQGDQMAVEVGADGQQETVDLADHPMNAMSQHMFDDVRRILFQGKDYLPVENIQQLCRTVHGGSWKDLNHCLATMSTVTPDNMGAVQELMKDVKSPMEGDEEVQSACGEMGGGDKRVQDACVLIFETSSDKQPPSKSQTCPNMNLGSGFFPTTKFAIAMNTLSPYFDGKERWHFLQDESELRKKYTVAPTAHGCGVLAQSSFKRGDLIGLAGVGEMTMSHGMAFKFQDSPWLGANMNHCPTAPNVVLRIQEDKDASQLWVYASKDIAPKDEIMMDYDAAHKDFPNWIEPAPEDWTCGDGDGGSQMRRAGPH